MDREDVQYNIQFKTPFTCIIAGPSKSGKTTWLYHCLKNSDSLFDIKPAYTIFYYSAWQNIYDQMKNENLVQEWKNCCPQSDYIKELALRYNEEGGINVIIDDMLSQLNEEMANMFEVISHHSKANLFFLSQNLFHEDKNYRSMKGNVNYLVLFKNPANKKQATRFFSNISSHPKALGKVFSNITREGYTYLLFDLHQTTPDEVRIRSKIFPHEGVTQVFVPPDLDI